MGYVIYEASAGSGKTTRMVYEYLQKLFFVQPQKLKNAIKSSIAITFTNKATSEMKERILSTLWKFINNQIPTEYIDLCKILNNSNIDIKKQSSLILSTILHNYYDFNITTIDSFIQKIARSIAYELDLPMNYKVSLDESKIITMACKRIIQKIGNDSEKSELTKILLQFADYIIFEKNQFNIESTMIAMVKSFSNERFSSVIDVIYDFLDMEHLYELCSEKYKRIKNELAQKANSFLKEINMLLDKLNLQGKDIFVYSGKGNYTLLQKLANPNSDFCLELVRQSFDRLKTPIKKNFNHNEKQMLENVIIGKFEEFIETYLLQASEPSIVFLRKNNKGSELLEADAILRTHFIIVLMKYIFKEIESISKEENTVLLHEFTRIMNKKILANDIPYIFMKLDCEITRLFIDEFQDTSQLQWNNLALFKENMISENRDFYIIGDPKQAIYRWRNGNVKIMLNEIEFIETNKLYNDNYEHKSLDTNYRSMPEIIEFNNNFFSKLIAILENDPYNKIFKNNGEEQCSTRKKLFENIITSYKKLVQKSSSQNCQEGFIKIDIIQRQSNAPAFSSNDETKQSDDEDSDSYSIDENGDYTENTTLPHESISKCVSFIKQLLSNGYKQKDIAVLIRENRQALPLAEAFLKENIDFINNNSLAVYNSPAVQCLVSVLGYFANTENHLSLYTAMQLFIQYYGDDVSSKTILETLHATRKSTPSTLSHLYLLFQASNWFEPFKTIKERFLALRSLDLYNLTEELIRIFKFNQYANDYIYLQFFLEYVYDYIINNQDSISNFLSYYKTNKDKFLVSLSEQTDAVQIMSIHMSKGLQFPVIVIPDADFTIKVDDYITAPIFSSLYTMLNTNKQKPIHYIFKSNNKILLQLKETVLPILEAKADAIHDNINLLYVAMTRPEQVLYMIVPVKETINTKKNAPDEKQSIIHVSSMSHYILKALEQSSIPSSIQRGSLPAQNSKLVSKDTKQVNNTLQPLFISNTWQSKLVIKTSTDKIEIALYQDRYKQIEFGNLMHRFLSEVHASTDISEIIKKPYYRQFSLDIQNNLLQNAEWVWNEYKNHGWISLPQHFFERGILYKGEEKRPDCVFADSSKAIIIEYKTGLQADEKEAVIINKYKNQLFEYSNIYQSMGYTDIKTYIVLPEKHKIIRLDE